MITQQQLTDKCTPEIIKKMCEVAEGFRYSRDGWFYNGNNGFTIYNNIGFPLLIHRAVSGFNKEKNYLECIDISCDCIERRYIYEYLFENYQPTTLTHAECAMLDCLLEVLK